MLKRLVLALLILSLVSSLAACGEDEITGAAISFPIAAEPSSLDPQICSDTSTLTAVNSLFEGLVTMGKDGEIIPGVAEKVDVSADGLVYTFTLRQDAKWHLIDNFKSILGENFKQSFNASVTANDFVFALRRALSPDTAAPDAKSLYAIKNAQQVHIGAAPASSLGVAAAGDKTLVITLSSASIDFLTILTQPICMPCNEKFFNATKGKYCLGLEYTMCNGPFYLSKWTPEVSILMRRNADYVGSLPVLPASVTLSFNDKTEDYAKKLADGTFDAAPVYSADLASLTNNTVLDFKNTVWSLCFNCADVTLSQIGIRLALCNAFEYSQLELSSQHVEATGVLPDCCRMGGKSYRATAGNAQFIEKDSAMATALWEQALNELETDSVELTVLCTQEYETAMRKQLQHWQQAFGVSCKISVTVTPEDELKRAVRSGNYQIALTPVTASSSSAALCLSTFTTESNGNVFNFDSEIYKNLLSTALSSANTASAATNYKTAETYLMQNGVILPVFCTSEYIALAEGVTGIYACPAGESVCFVSAEKAS